MTEKELNDIAEKEISKINNSEYDVNGDPMYSGEQMIEMWKSGAKYILSQQDKNKEEIICPFCGEDDFDKIGLKNHLHRYCEVYENIEPIR